jgi:lysophospholipase
MRRLLPFLLCAVLGACGRPEGEQPFTESRIPPGLAPRFWPPEGWAWGLVQVSGGAPVRYGVSAPDGVRPKGDVVIVTGLPESAETWFETVGALNREGYVVWVVDGGVSRDSSAVAAAITWVVRLAGDPPLLVAQGDAAPTALLSVAQGLAVSGVVLSAPVFDPADPPISAARALPAAAAIDRLGLGHLRALCQPRWRRPSEVDPGRAGVIDAWQVANPDLRFDGLSWGWIDAFERLGAELTPERLGRVRIPVLMLEPEKRQARKAGDVCEALPRCERRVIDGGRANLHREDEAVYRTWYAALRNALPNADTGA